VSRRTDLLKLAVDALEDGSDPFHESFLIENAVTLNEVYDLSDDLAAGGRLMLATMSDLRGGGLPAQAAAMRLGDAFARGLDHG